jgi:hypothetical protein
MDENKKGVPAAHIQQALLGLSNTSRRRGYKKGIPATLAQQTLLAIFKLRS